MDEQSQKKFANEPGNPHGPHRRATHAQMRIMDTLRNDGPSTATRLAAVLGESSGSTSYHLRVLAEAGVIEEDSARGNGRERWWRRVQPIFIPTDAQQPDQRALEMSLRLV